MASFEHRSVSDPHTSISEDPSGGVPEYGCQGRDFELGWLENDDSFCDNILPSNYFCGEHGYYEINGMKSVIDHSIREELCQRRCSHILAVCTTQLNVCAFYRELFMGSEVDENADCLYSGIAHGFDNVDPDCDTSYVSSNYSLIESFEFCDQMGDIIEQTHSPHTHVCCSPPSQRMKTNVRHDTPLLQDLKGIIITYRGPIKLTQNGSILIYLHSRPIQLQLANQT